MNTDRREEREAQIAAAAYALMAEKGLTGVTMTAVARKARASNETLYNWYGDRIGLFRMLIRRNADRVLAVIQAEAAQDDLQVIGEALLSMLLSPEAIALNRAAAADGTDALGLALAEEGRGRVLPVLRALFGRLPALCLTRDEALALWLDLLVGDWQVRCVTGAAQPPGAETRAERARRAASYVLAP